MVNFNRDHQAVLDEILLENPLVGSGKMFGYLAYYVGKKLSICLYEEGVGLKLPAETATKLLEEDENTIPFQPLGRPKMKEWIQINLDDSKDYWQYTEVFEESIQFIWEQQQQS